MGTWGEIKSGTASNFMGLFPWRTCLGFKFWLLALIPHMFDGYAKKFLKGGKKDTGKIPEWTVMTIT